MRSNFLLREHAGPPVSNAPVRQKVILAAASPTTVGGTNVLPSVPLAGSVIAVEVFASNAITVSSLSGLGVVTWNQSVSASPLGALMTTYYGLVATTPTRNLTITFSGTIASAECYVLEIVGVTAVDTFNISSGTNTSPTIPTLALSTTGETVISQTWMPGSLSRSGASAFPLTTSGNGTLTSGSFTKGLAGDIVLVYVAISSPTITAASVTLGGSPMALANRYFDSTVGVDVELWSITLASSGGSTSVVVTPSSAIGSTYVEITIDEINAGLGPTTTWTLTGASGNHHLGGILFPSLSTNPVGPQAYVGYAYPSTNATGGITPVNGQAFVYTTTGGSHQSLVALGSNLPAGRTFQPSGTQSGTSTGTVTRAAGFPIAANGDTASTPAPTTITPPAWVAVGDLAVLGCSLTTKTISISSISGTHTGSWTRLQRNASAYNTRTLDIWTAPITATGVDTLTMTYSGSTSGIFGDFWPDELTSTLGATTSWSVATSGTTGSAATVTTVPYPSLTSGVAGEAYWGIAAFSNGLGGGSTSGFIYTDSPLNSGNEMVFHGSLAASTPYAPTTTIASGSPAGTYDTVAIIFSATNNVSSASFGAMLSAGGPQVTAVSDHGFIDSFNPIGQNPGIFQSYQSFGSATSYTPEVYTQPSGPWYSQATAFKNNPIVPNLTSVLYIWMENESENQVYGNSACPNINSLANTYAMLPNSYGEGHESLPNYCAAVYGQIFANTSTDQNPSGQAGNALHIGDQCDAAGIVWGGYFQNIPSNPMVDGGGTNPYGDPYYFVHHNPFVYANSYNAAAIKSDTALITDLNSPNPPRFAFFAPNTVNDQHDGPLGTGDTYLGNLVSQVQATNWYKNGGVIIVTYDEGATSDTAGIGNYNPGGGNVLTIVISQALLGYGTYAAGVNHVGILGSIERVLGLSTLANAANSSNGNIDSLLNPTPPPTTIVNTSLPGGQVGSAYSANLVASGGTPPYTWTASPLPSGLTLSGSTISGNPTTSGTTNVVIGVKDSSNPQQSVGKTLSIVISPAGSGPIWSVDTVGPLVNTSSTSIPFASLSPASTPETYIGFGISQNTAVAGSTSGYTYLPTSNGNLFLYNTNVTAASSPTASQQVAAASISLGALIKLLVSGSPSNPYPLGTFYQSAGPGNTSVSVTSHSVNNILVAAININSPSVSVTSMSGGGVASWIKITSDIDGSINEGELWWGVVTTPGTSNVVATFSSSVASLAPEVDVQEFSPVVPPLSISLGSLPSGNVGSAYHFTLQATGGQTPYTWIASPLPTGLTCSTSGIISGTPTTPGSTNVTVQVTDSTSPIPQTANNTFSLTINAASAAKIIVGAWANDNEANTAAAVTAFNGIPANAVMMAFGSGASWTAVQSTCVGMAGGPLAAWPGIRLLAVPMQTTGAPGLYTDVTSGANDSVFTNIASACATNGVTLIRLGWEYQNNPSGNMPPPVPATSFRNTFDHIVTVMRGVDPGLKFIFNPNDGANGGDNPDYLSVLPTTLIPGDLVGLDTYDNNLGWSAAVSGATPNLTQIASLAASNGFDIAIPEWSMIPGGQSYSSPNNGDDPAFVSSLWSWAKSQVAAGRNVYLLPWCASYPTIGTGNWGLQDAPNSWAQWQAVVAAG